MRPLILLVVMAGCANAQAAKPKSQHVRWPCTFYVKVTLTEDYNEDCHAAPLHYDDDKPIPKDAEVWGCADSQEVISNGALSNLMHEFGEHVIPENCPEWANFDSKPKVGENKAGSNK